jgi:iron complex transport system permease protein
MKITIDIDEMLNTAEITTEQYNRLRIAAQHTSGRLGLKVLTIFGIVATAGGTLGLFPSGYTALFLGVMLSALGGYLVCRGTQEWRLVGFTLLLVGIITAIGGALYAFPMLLELLTKAALALERSFEQHTFAYMLAVTLLLLAMAIAFKSGFVSVLAVLALAGAIGAATDYAHACYGLVVRQPALTVAVFGALSWLAIHTTLHVAARYSNVAIMFARASFFLMNLGFWVGSLWGDSLGQPRSYPFEQPQPVLADWMFVIGWAAALLAAGVWAVRANRRWVLIATVVFSAIHFYTQFFERLGASPGSFLAAGLGAIAMAFAILRYKRVWGQQNTPQSWMASE